MPLTISNFQTIDHFLKSVYADYFKKAKLKIAFEYKGHICTGDFLILNNHGNIKKEKITPAIGRYETDTERNPNINEITDFNDIPDDDEIKNLHYNLNIICRTSQSIHLFQKYLLELVEKSSKKNNLPNVVYNLKFLDSPSVPVFPSVNVSDDEIKFIAIYPTADPDTDAEE